MPTAQELLEASDTALVRLEAQLKIDKYALDDELINQPSLYNEVAQRFADAVSYRDEAKAEFEGTKAMVDLELRMRAQEENVKMTETAVANNVVVDQRYQRAQAGMAAWNDQVNRWVGLREAVSQRGYALKDLVALHNAAYWADQSVVEGARERRREVAEAGRKAVMDAQANKRPRERLPT